MAILSAAEIKALNPKASGVADSAIQIHLDSSEARIRRLIGDPAGVGVVDRLDLRGRVWDPLRLSRPVLDGDKTNIQSIVSAGETTEETLDAASYRLIEPRTIERSGDCWPNFLITVRYTAETMLAEAKNAQQQLVAISLIADGLLSIEDGEFIEKRRSGTRDSLVMSEQRIYASLLRGERMIVGA